MSERQALSRARRLLAVDAAGAALTAIITLGLLASGLVATGVPAAVWCVLGGIALVLCARGLKASRLAASPRHALRAQALANVAYAVASTGVIVAHRDTVTLIATAYVLIEALVLVVLATHEWRIGGADDRG